MSKDIWFTFILISLICSALFFMDSLNAEPLECKVVGKTVFSDKIIVPDGYEIAGFACTYATCKVLICKK